MGVWKRYLSKRVKRGDKNYDRATWIAEGQVEGQRYNVALPKESVRTAEQARAADDEIKASIRSGDFHIKQDRTKFSDYVDTHYLPFCASNSNHFRQKTYECKTLKNFFGNVPLKSITPSRCEQFKRFRTKQKVRCQKCENGILHTCNKSTVSNSTVNREIVTLKGIFNRAEADKKIRDNPMRFVPLLEEPPSRERFLTPDERAKLIEVVSKNYQLHAIVMIGLLTGWRKNQILNMRLADIDFDEKKVWVSKQKRKPRRKIAVGRYVWSVLMSLADVREDYLFINPSGERLKEFNPAWWKALDEAGIENFRFHDLRHSFATSLLEMGMNEFSIQKALGHSRIQTTQDYAHVKDAYLREGLDALETGEFPNFNLGQID